MRYTNLHLTFDIVMSYRSVEFSSDVYFGFTALAAWAATDSLCRGVIRSMKQRRFESVSELFISQ